jgi:hypothetical protein|tara:strand:+ start:315 stop:536 length:222 start_codon:yes stop_codon:yes gene_type:complete
MIGRIIMKKYKVRLFGLGIDAKALIPFPYEPTLDMIENAVAEYLNEGLMKIESDDFYLKDKYVITYEEMPVEL